MVQTGSRRAPRARVLFAFAVVAALVGCPGGKKTGPGAPASAQVTGSKALFAATVSDTAPSLVLHRVNADDTIARVAFHDASGARVEVTVTQVKALSDDWVWLRIGGTTVQIDPPYVLLRLSDGKLFDASGLSDVPPQVKGGTLYGIGELPLPGGNGATRPGLVRVDLSTMLAYPMTNPAYDAIWPDSMSWFGAPFVSAFYADHLGNVRAWASGGTSVDSYQLKIFFADGTPPVVDPWSVEGTRDLLCNDGYSGKMVARMYGEDQHLYAVCMENVPDPLGGPSDRMLRYFVRDVRFTSTGTQVADAPPVRIVSCGAVCTEWIMRMASSYDLRPRARFVPVSTGFFTLTPVPAGGIALAWTDLAIPSLAAISGEYGYWHSGDTISRIRFQAGATPDPIVTSRDIIRWDVVGGVVVFTRYLTGTQVATYRVAAPGMDPELIASSDMLVQQIQEL